VTLHYLTKQHERLADGIVDTIDAMASINEELNYIQSSYSTAARAIEEYNETGSITIATLQSLLELSPQYLAVLDFQNGKLIINEEHVRMLTEALKEEAIIKLQNAAASDIKAYADGRVEDMSLLARSAVAELGSSALIAGSQMSEASSGAFDFAVGVAAIMAADGSDVSGITASVDAIVAAYNRAANNIRNVSIDFGGVGRSSGRTSSGSNSGDLWLEAANQEMADLRWLHDRKLISEETFLNRLDALNRRFFANRAEYLEQWRRLELETVNGIQRTWEESINLQIAQAGRNNDIERQISLYRELQNSLHETANKFRELGFDGASNEIMGLQSIWMDFHQTISELNLELVNQQQSVQVVICMI